MVGAGQDNKNCHQSSISVCMATYNGELYLDQQLKSIIDQLGPEDELIVSDDSSTDQTVAILKRYEGPNVKLFLGNRFRNPIENFEFCLKQANHNILVLADQDDVWLNNRLAIIREYMGDTEKVCAMMTDADMIDAEGQKTGDTLFRHFRVSNGVFRNLVWNCYTGCAMAISRPLLHIALPFPKGIPMHDAWLGLLSNVAGSMQLIPEKTFLYRRHQQNTSGWRWQPVKQLRWRWVLGWQLWQRLKLHG